MKSRSEVMDMILEIRKQGDLHEGGPIRDMLHERSMALAWVLGYPEVQTALLTDKQIELLKCP